MKSAAAAEAEDRAVVAGLAAVDTAVAEDTAAAVEDRAAGTAAEDQVVVEQAEQGGAEDGPSNIKALQILTKVFIHGVGRGFKWN